MEQKVLNYGVWPYKQEKMTNSHNTILSSETTKGNNYLQFQMGNDLFYPLLLK